MRIFKKFTAVAMALCVCFALFAASCENDPSGASSGGTSSIGGTSSTGTDSNTSSGDTSSVVSEGTQVTPPDDGSEAPQVEFELNTQNATLHGKYSQEMGGYSFSYGSAGFSANFTGTEFWIYVPEVPMDGSDVRNVGVAVLVDSEMAMDANMYSIDRTGWHKVAEGLTDGDHHIEIRKMSRGFYGMMASDWFVTSKFGTNEGGVVKTPDVLSDLVIEVYGDSISNGDAVWLDEEGIFGTAGANHAYTFGNYTGVIERLLDAEVRVCANTGNGLCGWVMATAGNGEVENLLPPQNSWNVIDANHNSSPYSHEGANAADVVIVNLGTNDRIELGGGDLTDTAFEDEYIRFIKQVKTDCPDAIFICTVGAMGQLKGDNYEVDFDRITSTVNSWAGEEFCYYVELQWADTISGGPGYDGGHPSNVAHEIYGLQLSTLINKKLNLGKTLPTDIPESAYEGYVDVTDPAKVGTPISGGAVSEDKVADNMFDANLGTGWQPSDRNVHGENCYAGVTFAAEATLNKVTITWEYSTRPTEGGYRLEYTTDGSTWKTVTADKTTENIDTDPSDDTDFNYMVDTYVLDNLKCKGVRVVVLENVENKTYAAQIFEMEISSTGKFIPEGNLMNAITGKTDNLSRIEDLL